MKMKLRMLLVLALLGLGGCGFHLVGNRPLPEALRSVYINVIAPYRVSEPPLEGYLRSSLLRRGGQVQGKVDPGVTVIRLSGLKEGRTVLSIGQDGKALEYQLTTSVQYEVMRDGKVILPSDSLSVSRDYSFNAQQVLAKEAEEARLRDFIQNELAELLLLRLETTLSHAAAEPAAKPDVVPVQ